MKKIFSFQKLTTRGNGIFDFHYKKVKPEKPNKGEQREKMRLMRREKFINPFDPERCEDEPLSSIPSNRLYFI